jgi:hypothetical protein
MQLLHLLFGDLGLLQAGLDLGEGQKAPLVSLGDQRTEFFRLRNRRVIAQENDFLNAHSP